MQVELIGCTSAGKSTLTQHMLKRAHAEGIKLSTSYDFVLAHYGLGWVKPHALRMALLNNLALWRCLQSAGRHLGLLRFVFGVLHTLPAVSQGKMSRSERLKIARITLRNLGIHEIIAQANDPDLIILADEGALQVVHYLFVHVQMPPALDQLSAYLQRAPRPDLVLYYRQPAPLLVERTLRRGHKRIPERSQEKVERFIGHALQVFEAVVAEPAIRQRALLVNGQSQQIEYSPAAGSQPGPIEKTALAKLVARLITEGIEPVAG
jgi:hypothetical protein